MVRIFVVDDDDTFLRDTTFALVQAGFQVTPFSSGRDLLNRVRTGNPQLILLDRVLPEIDGFTLCKKIKLRYPQIPLMMFSTLGEAADQVAGLSLGADDYLPKPFPNELLLAKVNTLLRRHILQGAPQVYTDGDLVLNQEEHRASLEGTPLELTKTEFELLALLMEQCGKLVTYGDIINKIMPHHQNDEDFQIVYFHMTSLRRKLGSYAKHIHNVRGMGYRYQKGGG